MHFPQIHGSPLSHAAGVTALPEGEPLAGRFTFHWTPEVRQDAKGRALLTGTAASGLRSLSSCRWPRQRSTAVSEILCFAHPDESWPTCQGLSLWGNGDDRRQWRKQGGAVGAAASRMRAAAKQTLGAATRPWRGACDETERARPLTTNPRHCDSIALTKSLPIAAQRLFPAGLALSVIASQCHLSQRERLWQAASFPVSFWRNVWYNGFAALPAHFMGREVKPNGVYFYLCPVRRSECSVLLHLQVA